MPPEAGSGVAPEVAPGVIEQPSIEVGPTAHRELDAVEVKRLAMRGVGTLVARSVTQRMLMMVGNVLLARWLVPEVFGVYAIASFLVGMASFLADLGMGASLVQRKEGLTENDLRAAFTLSLAMNAVVTGTLLALAPVIVGAYGLGVAAAGPVRVMAISVLVGAFAVVPSIRLERVLRFQRLSIADVAAQVAYLTVALPLAFHRRDVWAFVLATIASRVTYTVLVTAAAPWRPRFGLARASVRQMISFGLPFQMTGLVNMFKDNPIPTFIAVVAGPRAVGYVTWGLGLATNALFLIPIVSRVTFPAYARLQHDVAALKVSIEKSIKWVAATVFPATLFMAALAPWIVEHVYGKRWQPGLASFYWFCIPMLNAAYSTVMVSALYGLGRAKVVLRLTAIWALAGWGLGVPLTLAFGFNGFAAGMSVVSWLSFLSVRELNKVVRVSFVPTLVRIFVLSAIPATFLRIAAPALAVNIVSLLALALAGGATYLLLMYASGELDEVRRVVKARLSHA